MPQTTDKSQSAQLPLWIGAGVAAAGLVAAVLVLLPDRSASQPPQPPQPVAQASQQAWQEHQAQVSAVIGAKDRASLIGDSPTKGSAEARIILFKFSDFQCPYCAVSAADMKSFVADHETEILYVYKHFPLTQIHDEAMPAAKAAWAAGQQGQFWLYHDGLFANQDRLGEALYVELATQMGLDMAQFNQDRASEAAQAAIEADLALVQELGLNATPTFLMNDLLIPAGLPLEAFEELLDRMTEALDAQAQP